MQEKRSVLRNETSMLSVSNTNRLGYIILTIGVIVGLFAAYQNDNAIRTVNEKQTKFIVRQCDREKVRNKIAIGFLERDRTRVLSAKDLDPAIKTTYLSTIDGQVKELDNIPPCRLP